MDLSGNLNDSAIKMQCGLRMKPGILRFWEITDSNKMETMIQSH